MNNITRNRKKYQNSKQNNKACENIRTDLEIPQLWECVDDNAEDDIEADGRDEDEEGHVEDEQESEPYECVLLRVTYDALRSPERDENKKSEG